ncbi:MAG TPA: signal recognition particle-docking protein FtsY [Oligoflexia bacterium]|nr:signal recognition particle-docking protein FtsY [Oligoflexia bacterium]HMP27184.1 signal recognition particle-docking protein FtsY [Oligoflexia bacterium]
MSFEDIYNYLNKFLAIANQFETSFVLAVVAILVSLIALSRISRQKLPAVVERVSSVMGRLEKIERSSAELRTEIMRALEIQRIKFDSTIKELSKLASLSPETRSQLESILDIGPLDLKIDDSNESSSESEEDKLLSHDTSFSLDGRDDEIARKLTIDLEGEHALGGVDLARDLKSSPPSAKLQKKSSKREDFRAVSLGEGLKKSRTSLFQKIKNLFAGKPSLPADMIEDLEELLISSDIGTRLTSRLLDAVRSEVAAGRQIIESEIVSILKREALEILGGDLPANLQISANRRDDGPTIILVVGVNGVGKTTTVAKLAGRFAQQGLKVQMIAADTFRAAAIDQLTAWGEKLEIRVVSGDMGAKPSAVVFDGVQSAIKENYDVVLIDTAGRLHTKGNLMQELEGVRNVIKKLVPSAPHETLLVVDGTTGQNAILQAREFNAATPLSGLIVTKLDGTAKGGVVVAIKDELKVPIKFIGIGERAEDLIEFDREKFVEALFSDQDKMEVAA